MSTTAPAATFEQSHEELLDLDLKRFFEQATSAAIFDALGELSRRVGAVAPLMAANIGAARDAQPDRQRAFLVETVPRIREESPGVWDAWASEVTTKWLSRLDAERAGTQMPEGGFLLGPLHHRNGSSGFPNGHNHDVIDGRVDCLECFALAGPAYGYQPVTPSELERVANAAASGCRSGRPIETEIDAALAANPLSQPTVDVLVREALAARVAAKLGR
jgi:hypothetical protein